LTPTGLSHVYSTYTVYIYRWGGGSVSHSINRTINKRRNNVNKKQTIYNKEEQSAKSCEKENRKKNTIIMEGHES